MPDDLTPLVQLGLSGTVLTLCGFLVRWIVRDSRRQVEEWRAERDHWRSIAERMVDTDHHRGIQVQELIEGNRVIRAALEQSRKGGS